MISLSAFAALPEIPDFALRNGLGLEFTGLINSIFYSDEYIENIKTLPHSHLFTSAHGPFYDLVPGSSDSEVRDLAKAKFIRSIDACDKIGINHLIFHTGWNTIFCDDNKWINNSIKFWKDIIDYSENNVSIYIENVFEIKPYLIKDIIDGVNNKRFKSCLDVGHVNAFAKGNVLNWIELLGNRIGHVHLHNNFGVNDDHNGLNDGNLDIKTIIKYININCPKANLNLEIRTDIEKSIEMINLFRKNA